MTPYVAGVFPDDNMHTLLKLTDREIFPNNTYDDVTEWFDRKTVKVIIVKDDGKIALVTNRIHKCHLLPGGGVDGDEGVVQTAVRESREEANCSINEIRIIGVVEEYRARDGKHYLTTGVIAKAGETVYEDTRTDNEKNLEMAVGWFSLDEVKYFFKQQKDRLRNGEIDFYNTSFNIVRDSAFLDGAERQGLLK